MDLHNEKLGTGKWFFSTVEYALCQSYVPMNCSLSQVHAVLALASAKYLVCSQPPVCVRKGSASLPELHLSLQKKFCSLFSCDGELRKSHVFFESFFWLLVLNKAFKNEDKGIGCLRRGCYWQ